MSEPKRWIELATIFGIASRVKKTVMLISITV